MTIRIDRRSLIIGGSLGLGALLLPGGGAIARTMLGARGFTHSVASGEPAADSVLLWTRYVSAGEAALAAEVSERADFATIVAGGRASASPEHDFTARVTVAGLTPDRWYFYRFRTADGAVSPIGRTRTLPAGPSARFALGVFSCANLPFGWFNAYAHAAARGDLDLMIHVGDYLYEYQRGTYPAFDQAVKERIIEPAGELLHLADYRLRYGGYRADPDLQQLHRLFPMVAQFDDHEIANDAWVNGAQNHQSGEGDYQQRKAAALKAWHEWMPVSDAAWSRYEIGDLATLVRPETRISGRSAPVSTADALRDRASLTDPARTMLGMEQETWLADSLAHSVKRGAKWQIVAQQTNVGHLFAPANLREMLAPGASDYVLKSVEEGLAAAKAGIPAGLDNWGGFPAARTRLLRAAESANADLLVLAGDSHNAFAFELPGANGPAGVEFGGHSVTSSGYESYLAAAPGAVAQALRAASPELKWTDTSRRGYMTIELTPERATGEWLFMETIGARNPAVAGKHRMVVERGRRTFAA